jgi:hypothetical protein
LATYSKNDFERIAAAIGKDVVDVKRQEKNIEASAMWYRLGRRGPRGKRITPYMMRRRMTQIANAAQRLLEHLGVPDPTQPPDGPATAVLEILASAEGGTEDAVIRATARLGHLLELLGAADATRELERLARRGAEDVEQIGKLIVPKGHHGDVAENDWISAMMSIYRQITGKDPRSSVGAPLRNDEGLPGGPLIRFLQTAGNPIGIEYSPNAWRSRVRAPKRRSPQKIDSIRPFRPSLPDWLSPSGQWPRFAQTSRTQPAPLRSR